MRSTMTDYYNAGAGIGAGFFGNRQKEKRFDANREDEQKFRQELQDTAQIQAWFRHNDANANREANLDRTLGNRLELQKLSNAGDFWQDLFRNNDAAAKAQAEAQEAARKRKEKFQEQAIGLGEFFGDDTDATTIMQKIAGINRILQGHETRGKELANYNAAETLTGKVRENAIGALQQPAMEALAGSGYTSLGGTPVSVNEQGVRVFSPDGVRIIGSDGKPRLGPGFSDPAPLPKGMAPKPVVPPVSQRQGMLPPDLQQFDFLLKNSTPYYR